MNKFMPRGYGRVTCWIFRDVLKIEKRISTGGLGFVSHMRAHVKRGEATEHYVGDYPHGHNDYEPVAPNGAGEPPLEK